MRNRAENAATWQFEQLLVILLRQFKRLLAERDLPLTEAQIEALATRQTTDAQVIEALAALVEESVGVLQRWNLTYAQSLATQMDDMPGWETTADFLEIANEKGNAELRISSAGALLAGLGDARYADYLWACYQHGADDAEDVDAVIARRALLHVAGIAETSVDWADALQQWLAQRV